MLERTRKLPYISCPLSNKTKFNLLSDNRDKELAQNARYGPGNTLRRNCAHLGTCNYSKIPNTR